MRTDDPTSDCLACDGDGYKHGAVCRVCKGTGRATAPKPEPVKPQDKAVWRNGARVRR